MLGIGNEHPLDAELARGVVAGGNGRGDDAGVRVIAGVNGQIRGERLPDV